MDCFKHLIHSNLSSSAAADILYTVCLPSTTCKSCQTKKKPNLNKFFFLIVAMWRRKKNFSQNRNFYLKFKLRLSVTHITLRIM